MSVYDESHNPGARHDDSAAETANEALDLLRHAQGWLGDLRIQTAEHAEKNPGSVLYGRNGAAVRLQIDVNYNALDDLYQQIQTFLQDFTVVEE